MRRYSAVVFDWDGTVMDSTHSIVISIQSACVDIGLPVPDAEQARWVIGLSLESALYRAVPTLTAEQLPQFVESFRKHYLQKDGELYLFDGILDMFSEIRQRQVVTAVATGKSRKGLDRALARLQLQDYFRITRCADESVSKPDPTMLLEIMEALSLPPERILMVGDTTHDLEMAARAGVDSVAVTYGAHDRATLLTAKPTAMVSNVAQLRSWLLPRLDSFSS